MEKGSSEGSPFNKLVEMFSSPRKSLPGRFLQRIHRSSSDTSSVDSVERDYYSQTHWVADTKLDIAAASSLEELKPHLFLILDRVHNLESEVKRERQSLSKDIDVMRKHKQSPFRSLSGFLSKASSTNSSAQTSAETSPIKVRHDPRVYIGHRRRSSSDIIISPRVAPIPEESAKPRRKSTIGIMKLERKKSMWATKTTRMSDYTGPYRRRSSSTSVIEKRTTCTPR